MVWTEGKRLGLFLGLTFALSWAYEIFLLPVLLGIEGLQGLSSVFISAVMFLPALCMIATRLLTKEGFKDAWIKPNFKAHWKYYLLAWLLPVGLILIGGGVYFLCFPANFDWNVGYGLQSLQAAGQSLTADQLRATLLIQGATIFLTAPLSNLIPCIGEEWGWRGYLVPKLLRKLPLLPTLLLSGLIWGLWHAPLTALGHNYGTGYAGFPYTGIAMMCLFCMVVGIFLSYVSQKAQSCLPAALAHAMLNGFGSFFVYFLPSMAAFQPFVGPVATGILGMTGFIGAALVFLLLFLKEKKAKGAVQG